MSVLEKHPETEEDHEHHEDPFWKKYIFSQDHKVIGIQYLLTSLVFLLFGFCLMLLMRWQLAKSVQAESRETFVAGRGQQISFNAFDHCYRFYLSRLGLSKLQNVTIFANTQFVVKFHICFDLGVEDGTDAVH